MARARRTLLGESGSLRSMGSFCSGGAQADNSLACSDLSKRTSLADSTRQSPPQRSDASGSGSSRAGSSPNRQADSSLLSRISTAADEDVRAFKAFRLSNEESGSDAGGDEDEELNDLSQVGGIDWDDVLRDVGQGGGKVDEDERFSFDGGSEEDDPVELARDDSFDRETRYDDQDDVAVDEDNFTGQENEPPLASAKASQMPVQPQLAKTALARKKRAALSTKMQRFTPSGAPLADMPTAKVRAMFERATGGEFGLSDEGVEAVMDRSVLPDLVLFPKRGKRGADAVLRFFVVQLARVLQATHG